MMRAVDERERDLSRVAWERVGDGGSYSVMSREGEAQRLFESGVGRRIMDLMVEIVIAGCVEGGGGDGWRCDFGRFSFVEAVGSEVRERRSTFVLRCAMET